MMKLFRRFLYFVTERKRQAELSEELDFHREMKGRELLAHGTAPEAAQARAKRALGSSGLAYDEARDAWIPLWFQDLWGDLRFAARILIKDRRFAATAVLALALGIAVNNTIFTLINTAVLKDVPFDDPDQLVSIGTRDDRGRDVQVSYPDFQDWRTATRTFTDIGANTGFAMNVGDDAQAPERVRGAYLSANAFSILRVEPVLGRAFVDADDRPGAPAVVLLGYGFWQRRYGGDRSVLGRTIRVNDLPSNVIGIMPPGFRFPFSDEVWQPLVFAPTVSGAGRDLRVLSVFGRLADSRTIDQGRAELDAIAARLALEHPETNKGIRPRVTSMNERVAGAEPILMALMGSVVFVLLIACANVANLLLARSTSRARELAIRASLGATRWRIVRQLLIECGMLATLATVLGLTLSIYGVKFLGVAFDGRQPEAPMSAAATPYWVDLSMNEPVYLFLAGVCLLTTLLAGLAPALHVSKPNNNEVLKDGGRGASGGLRARRWTGTFMVAQIALTLVLLTGAGLMLRTFITLYRAERVIDTDGLITARIALPIQRYATVDMRQRFFQRLDERLSVSPLLSGVAIATNIPFRFVNSTRLVLIDDQSQLSTDTLPTVTHTHADRRYFETLGVRIARGRDFIEADARPGQEGVIVNQRFAEMFFPGSDAVGRRVRLTTPVAATTANSPWQTIVGVVPNIPQRLGRRENDDPAVFEPLFGQMTPAVVSLFVRTRSDTAAAVSVMRDEVRALDPNLPVYYAQAMEEAFADSRVQVRVIGGWFAALAMIALLLATVGLYAVTGHAVAQRTREIGVRVALGAQMNQVVWLFLRRTLTQIAIGTCLGLAMAVGVIQALRATPLVGSGEPHDPVTLGLVIALLMTVAVTATLLPARRATRVDPIVALRYE